MRLTRHLALLVACVVLLVACGNEDADTAQDQVPPQAEETAQDASEATKDALASLRTDAERFVDELQTSEAPRAKQALLDKCRDVLERLRRDDSDAVPQAERTCERIQETDVTNRDAWNEIRAQIARLDPTG